MAAQSAKDICAFRCTMLVLGYFCLGLFATIEANDNRYLFYSTEGPDNLPGVYGGYLKGNDLRQEVLTCVGQQKGLNVSSMSYDPSRKEVVLLLENEDGDNITILRSTPCYRSMNHCAQEIIIDGPLPKDGSIVKIGPVATYGGGIYFISRSCVNDTFSMDIRQLIGHHFHGCRHPHIEFDYWRCTERVASYVNKDGCSSLSDTHVPLGNLLVTENANGKLVFLFQVLNGNLIELDAVTSSGNQVVTISRPEFKLSQQRMLQSGGLSLHPPNVLCWSDVFSIHCGYWAPDTALQDKTQVVQPQQVQQVCGTLTDEDLQSVVTGVAIVSTAPLEVYFGCHGNAYGEGGAGWSKPRTNNTYDVKQLTDARGQLRASSLFVAHCPAEVPTSLSLVHKDVFFEVLILAFVALIL